MTAAEEATSSASAASRSCGMTSTRVRRISEGVLSRNGPQDWFRAFACVGRYHKLSGTVRPTKPDVAARFIARNTAPAPEMGARALTWGAGEKVLLGSGGGWLAGVARAIMLCWSPWRRRCCPWFETSVRPDRPDRRTEIRHLHGVPFSRIREDAFPSGHALHIAALALAAGALPAGPRLAIRAVAVGISLTRLVVLAHWASDVVAGFALGAVLVQFVRLCTGYPLDASTENDHADP